MKMNKSLFVVNLIACLILINFVLIAGGYCEDGAKFNYEQKRIYKVKGTEKNVRIKIAVSRFEDKTEIEGSPFNIQEDEEELENAQINIEGSTVTVRTDEDADKKKELTKSELLIGLLVDKLRKTGIFDVVERKEVNQLIREINFEKSNWVKQDNVNEIGNIYGVQSIVTGEILQNKEGHRIGKGKYTLALRLYNVNTGEIVSSSISNQNYLEDAAEEAVAILSEEIKGEPWSCRVVRINNSEIYINAGDEDDIEEKDVFTIYRIGGEIRDSVTNKNLGFEKTEIAKIKVSEVIDKNLSKVEILEQKEKIGVGDIVTAKRIDMKKKEKSSLWNEVFGENESLKKDSSLKVSKTFRKTSSSISTVEDIVREYGQSIVLVQVGQSVGSGFVVSSDGYILTNSHVLQGSKNVTIKMIEENKVFSNVEVVKDNPIRDIALLKVNDVGRFYPVVLGDSESVSEGEKVVAIGNPAGLENTVSDGLISSIRNLDGTIVFQISVPISPGSSGGALFNMQGQVIGITTLTFTEGQNINFAVAINYAKDELSL